MIRFLRKRGNASKRDGEQVRETPTVLDSNQYAAINHIQLCTKLIPCIIDNPVQSFAADTSTFFSPSIHLPRCCCQYLILGKPSCFSFLLLKVKKKLERFTGTGELRTTSLQSIQFACCFKCKRWQRHRIPARVLWRHATLHPK